MYMFSKKGSSAYSNVIDDDGYAYGGESPEDQQQPVELRKNPQQHKLMLAGIQ